MSTRKRFLALFLIASIVGAGTWWHHYRKERDESDLFKVPSTACELFSVQTLEDIAGTTATWYESRSSETDYYYPDLSCTLGLKGFGDIRIGYIDEPWFINPWSSLITEEDFKGFSTDHRWSLQELDLGREGNAYVSVTGDRESSLSYAAWYSSHQQGARTLSLVAFNGLTVPDPELSDAEIRETTIALFTYLVETVEERYPATAQPTPPLATASARES